GGELVFTAFSGSHQDAINKGLAERKQEQLALWDVPYLPIDPRDVGRDYEAVIRINSQSGKGGVAYVLGKDYDMQLPRRMQIEFSRGVKNMADDTGQELTSEGSWDAFRHEYLDGNGRFALRDYRSLSQRSGSRSRLEVTVVENGREKTITGTGNGPIDAFVNGINQHFGV